MVILCTLDREQILFECLPAEQGVCRVFGILVGGNLYLCDPTNHF